MFTKKLRTVTVTPHWLLREAAFYASLLLTAAATAVFACLLVGCGSYLPAGQLVLVNVDRAVADTVIAVVDNDGSNPGTVRLGDAICQGVRYWDAVGARLRCPEDIAAEDGAPAATLDIVRATAVEELFDSSESWYYVVDGKIHVPADRLLAMADASNGFARLSLTAMYAHESGHAFGLMHTKPAADLMNAHAAWRPDLSADDVAQFCKVTGSSAEACHAGN